MGSQNLQLDTIRGPRTAIAGDNLTDKEGYVCKLSNASGTPKAYLPDDVADEVTYVILSGAAAGERVELAPLEPGQQFRAILDGTCVTGDQITLAAINGTKDGKVVKLPASADTYERVALAEESGVDGGAVLLRYKPKQVIVS